MMPNTYKIVELFYVRMYKHSAYRQNIKITEYEHTITLHPTYS